METREIRAEAPGATWAGSACATGDNATAQAVEEAIGACGEASVVVAFSSGLAPSKAAAEIAEASGTTPYAAMTAKGAIGADGVVEHGCAALALGGPFRAAVTSRESVSSDLRAAANAATRDVLGELGDPEHALVLLMLDTPRSDQAEAIAGAYDAAGPAVPLAGGGAGGARTALLLERRATQDGLTAVAIAAPNAVGLGTAHGCKPIAAPSIVTGSDGLRVTELDGRPAAEVYLERLGYKGVDLDDGEFEALAVTHPLAQPELNGDSRLRHVRWRQDGGLACATHLPPGAAVEITHQSPEDIVAAASRAVSRSLEALGTEPRAALVFDCAGRKGAIGGALQLESSALYEAFSGVPPLAGAFTYGEIARARGAKGDRNHACVVATFA